MDILTSIKNQNSQRVLAFLEPLKSFDVIEIFKIVENNPSDPYLVKPQSDLFIAKKE